MRLLAVLVVVCIFLFSCKEDSTLIDSDQEIQVRIDRDPGRLFPMFATNLVSREIYSYIHPHIADYHPKTLQYVPILIKKVPEAQQIESGPMKGGVFYDMEFLDEAVWPDGSPIDAQDYTFTIKSILHPDVNTPSWKNYISLISAIEIDPDNNKRIRIYFKEKSIDAQNIAYGIEVFPEHIYDPDSALKDIPIAQFISGELDEFSGSESFSAFANTFNDSRFHSEVSVGSGPYRLTDWQTDQYIRIERKENYWGSSFSDRFHLQAKPKAIVFNIIPDEVTATTQLKSGAIDVMSFSNGENFNQLESDEATIELHTPELQAYYFIAMNNKSPKLSDRNVRRALSHLLDVDAFIDQIEFGLGERTVGPILPFRAEYNQEIQPIQFNVEKAQQILENAGWSDTNSNGTIDKQLLGQLTEMSLDIYVSQGALGQRLALLLTENAKKVGIQINTIQKANRAIRTEHIATGDFDLHPMVQRTHLDDYDPYNTWHSDNAVPGSLNYTMYENPKADMIIESLKTEVDEEKRDELYFELQEIMFDDQPVIFLYAPVAKIATNKNMDAQISEVRPGYFLQEATIRK